MNAILVIRNGEIKLRLPVGAFQIKDDGTIWSKRDQPLLVPALEQKEEIIALAKAKKWDDIPSDCFAKMGKNPSGALVIADTEWIDHPVRLQKEAEEHERKLKTAEIYLSSRGWGDYSAVEWTGDITRPESEILEECRELLKGGHDVDHQNQTDKELLEKIAKGKEEYQERLKKEEQKKVDAAKKEQRKSAAEMTTTIETVEDEGGKTKIAHHVVKLESGSSFKFTDRNIFDFGRVINPGYEIAPGVKGGMRVKGSWQTFESGKGWVDVRELTTEERIAYDYVSEFGYHAHKGIRM